MCGQSDRHRPVCTLILNQRETSAGQSESVKEEDPREFRLRVCDVAMRNFLAQLAHVGHQHGRLREVLQPDPLRRIDFCLKLVGPLDALTTQITQNLMS